MKTDYLTLSIILLIGLSIVAIPALFTLNMHKRLHALEVAQIQGIILPRERWVCVDVLRDKNGLVECKTWENKYN